MDIPKWARDDLVRVAWLTLSNQTGVAATPSILMWA